MNWQPIETAPRDRPVFVRAVDLSGFPDALKSGKPKDSMLPGITAWTTYHLSAGFTICEIRTTVQWDADSVPPTVTQSLTVPPAIKGSLTPAPPMEEELDAIQAEDAYAAARSHAYSCAKGEAEAALAQLPMDDDLNEPLGPACIRENPECESCQ